MMLLPDLPPEILDLILAWLDPNSLYVASVACRTFQTAVFSAKKPLLCHLSRLPGRAVDGTSLEVDSLKQLLNTRLHDSLQNGVNILADRLWVESTGYVKANPSLLEACGCSKTHCVLVMVNACDSSIEVYLLEQNDVVFSYCLETPFLALHGGSRESHDCTVEVLKVASIPELHNRRCSKKPTSKLVVLYGYRVGDDNGNSFIKAAVDRSQELLKLATFYGNIIYAMRDVPIERGEEVMGLTIGEEAVNAIIAIRNKFARVRLLSVDLGDRHYGGDMGLKVWPYHINLDFRRLAEVNRPRYLTNVGGKDDLIYLFSSLPVPEWKCTAKGASGGLVRDTYATFGDEFDRMAKFSLGPTFATYHRCKVRGLFANDKTCLNTALHVGFKHEHPKQIYLVKSGRDSSACSPLEVGIFYNHTKLFTVAKLDGFDGTIMPSIGPILAISAGGTRIATAHWKGVLVWAIDPEAFLDPFEDPSVDVKELDSADDSEYASSCGHSFYQVYERVGKAVVIPPVELPNDSVVHKLAFVGEDKLYGLTGHGLVSWDMRVGCAGRQTKRSFDKLNGVDSLVQDA